MYEKRGGGGGVLDCRFGEKIELQYWRTFFFINNSISLIPFFPSYKFTAGEI